MKIDPRTRSSRSRSDLEKNEAATNGAPRNGVPATGNGPKVAPQISPDPDGANGATRPNDSAIKTSRRRSPRPRLQRNGDKPTAAVGVFAGADPLADGHASSPSRGLSSWAPRSPRSLRARSSRWGSALRSRLLSSASSTGRRSRCATRCRTRTRRSTTQYRESRTRQTPIDP